MAHNIEIKDSSANEFDKISNMVFSIQEDIDNDGRPWYITATNSAEKVRSIAQNALLRCYYIEIKNSPWGKNQGYSIEDAEVYCKRNIILGVMKHQAKLSTKLGQHAKDRVLATKEMAAKGFSERSKRSWLLTPGWSSKLNNEHFKMYIEEIELHFLPILNYRLESINETLRNNALNIK